MAMRGDPRFVSGMRHPEAPRFFQWGEGFRAEYFKLNRL
jgi:hypothetical protein